MTRARQLVVGFAAFQLLDALGNTLAPRAYIERHLDHLGVPRWLRPLLSPIKVASSGGLLLGLVVPEVGAVTAAELVAYYAAAAKFHLLAGDHPIAASPAMACGAVSAVALLAVYRPEARRRARGQGGDVAAVA